MSYEYLGDICLSGQVSRYLLEMATRTEYTVIYRILCTNGVVCVIAASLFWCALMALVETLVFLLGFVYAAIVIWKTQSLAASGCESIAYREAVYFRLYCYSLLLLTSALHPQMFYEQK